MHDPDVGSIAALPVELPDHIHAACDAVDMPVMHGRRG